MAWINVLGGAAADLEARVKAAFERKLTAAEYSADDVKYIEKLDLSVVEEDLAVSDEDLERLRKLCRLWDVDLKVYSIKSHRRILGPFIVAAKKMLFPILRFFLKEFIKQQRAFNAEIIGYLASLSHRDKKS